MRMCLQTRRDGRHASLQLGVAKQRSLNGKNTDSLSPSSTHTYKHSYTIRPFVMCIVCCYSFVKFVIVAAAVVVAVHTSIYCSLRAGSC